MSVVYRVRDQRFGVERAIKLLLPVVRPGTRAWARFEREAAILAKLSHPNIVVVYDVGTESGLLYLVMELVEGGSLWDRVQQRGPLSAVEAIDVMVAVLSGLDAAHAKGIVHRDVKPHNILIGEDGTPKLADFGIARVLGSDDASATRTGSSLGTPWYMAPEQRANAKGVDSRADLYGVGATLYAACVGRNPPDLHAEEESEGVRAALGGPLAEVVLVATRALPDQRPESAGDLQRMLLGARRALTGEEGPKAGVPPRPRAEGHTPRGGPADGGGRGDATPGPSTPRAEASTLDSPRGRTAALGVAVGLILGVGLSVVFLTRQEEAAPELAAVPAPSNVGRLHVESRPEAALLIDGVERGVTPLTIELPAGPHAVALRAEAGVVSIPEAVVLTGGEERSLCWDLQRGEPCGE